MRSLEPGLGRIEAVWSIMLCIVVFRLIVRGCLTLDDSDITGTVVLSGVGRLAEGPFAKLYR